MTLVVAKSVAGDGRDMLDLATLHPHPTSGARYGWSWEIYGSQPWPSYYAGDYAALWRTQPSLRKVVDFIARNVAQVPLHAYRRVSDTDRVRLDGDHPLERMLLAPHPSQTRYRLVEALVTELCVFDRGYAVLLPNEGGYWLRQVPAAWSSYSPTSTGERVFTVRAVGVEQSYPPEQVFELAGYNPSPPTRCPPCETLRQVLAEDSAATDYRADLWRNGARLSGWIERPLDAPEWSDDARERFRREWHGRWSAGSDEAGGTPVLEEGMKFAAATATAEQSQYVEARKLTLAEVASAYQVPPPMVGLLDNANYSNTREFRKMLYQDTLGPWYEMLVLEVERQLVPRFTDVDDVYVEFNVAAKLAGAFEDQATVLSASVGGPWLTRNEARAKENLPHIDGADELIVPLNVTTGGQPSPVTPLNVVGPPAASSVPPSKCAVPADVQAVAGRALERNGHDADGARAATVLTSGECDMHDVWRLAVWYAHHAKDDPGFDLHGGKPGARWVDDMLAPSWQTTKARIPDTTRSAQEQALTARIQSYYDTQESHVTSVLDDTGSLPAAFVTESQDAKLARIMSPAGLVFALLGVGAVLNAAETAAFSAFGMGRWLTAHAARAASAINRTTYEQLAGVVLGDSWRDDVAHIYGIARGSRAPSESASWATTTVNFGGREGARHAGRTHKTWYTTSRVPRTTHARMAGETVPIEGVFSNGARFPGDPVLAVSERANCACYAEYT